MSYKNDHLLTISSKYGKASGEAKAQLFETYDRIRDISVSGSQLPGAGFGKAGSFLIGISRLLAPGAFMPVLGSQAMNIPGTSFSSPISGGVGVFPNGQTSFGVGQLSKYPGFPAGGAAPIAYGIGNMLSGLAQDFTVGGMPTGAAASAVGTLSTAGAVMGTASGASGGYGGNLLMPAAGVIAGIGGIITTMGPYLGSFGLGANLAGNLLQGVSSATLSAYQTTTGRILNNADIILSNKVKNIETVVKMLNTQNGVVKKMLKEAMDNDSKAIQNI